MVGRRRGLARRPREAQSACPRMRLCDLARRKSRRHPCASFDVSFLALAFSQVSANTPADSMESFFLSETLKYLYLIFDEENWVHKESPVFIWTTEGHPFPINASRNVDTTPWQQECGGFSKIMKGASTVHEVHTAWELKWPFSNRNDSLPMNCAAIDPSKPWDLGPYFEPDMLHF